MIFDSSYHSLPSTIYFLKRLLRIKWFERVVVCFSSWRNRYAVWLVKRKRTNHIIVYRQNALVIKSGSLGTEVEKKKQRRMFYFLKTLSKRIWKPTASQIQIQLKGNLKHLDLATSSIDKHIIAANKRLMYCFFGYRKWYTRVKRVIRKKLRRLSRRMSWRNYQRRFLYALYYKPYVVVHNQSIYNTLRTKWLENRLLSRKQKWKMWMGMQKKTMLSFQDKKKKTWYFYKTELDAALRDSIYIHSLADYSSHPFGGKRYRKRNVIR
jgi:hypothetical protein